MMIKRLFFALFVKPLVFFISGVRVIGKEKLPKTGPAIIAANHNSHFDTLVLLSLFSLDTVEKVRPVAAADFFLKNRLIAWFALNLIGIIPIQRRVKKSGVHPLEGVKKALRAGDIVVIYPEGSRGKPEEVGEFKRGIAHLALEFPNVPVFPVFMRGTGKALPKGEALFVPFIIDVVVGDPLYMEYGEEKSAFVQRLREIIISQKENRL